MLCTRCGKREEFIKVRRSSRIEGKSIDENLCIECGRLAEYKYLIDKTLADRKLIDPAEG